MHTLSKLIHATPLYLTYRSEVQPEDLAAVHRLVESAGVFSPTEVAVAVELVEERLAYGTESGYHFIFVEEVNCLIGYACYGPVPLTAASFDLYWIVVDKAVQGRRVGKELLRRVEEKIAQLGGRQVYIETSSRSCYAPARNFYLSCGYRQAAVLKDFYAPGDDKVIYGKVLSVTEGTVNDVSLATAPSRRELKPHPTTPQPR